MKPAVGVFAGLLAVAITTATGYWLGQRATAPDPGAAATMPAGAVAPAGRKLLYYRNPMGLPDTSPVPKKDPMGMDYIPVYAGEPDDEPAANVIRISPEKIQKMGVRSEVAQRRTLDRVVHAAGRVEADERRVYTVSAKFEGYIERLHVNVTGQPVSKGQALFDVYSPELLSAQREYLIAAQGVESLQNAGGQAREGMRQLADASLRRLRNWDISDEQLRALAKSGEIRRTLSFRSPAAGIVTEKKALPGMRFMPGEALYQIADLSTVWVVADVFEQDIASVRSPGKAGVRVGAYPNTVFEGSLTYVYPTLKAETRTVPVRVELANPGYRLKPGMYAQVDLPVLSQASGVVIPNSAVIDSGTRTIVLVQAKEGRFEPREVKLGQRSDSHVEVLSGVSEGERVVVAANFLIDAESNLKAALSGFADASPPEKSAAKSAGHQAKGTVSGIDAQAGVLTVNHEPIASLRWPSMTMEFLVANSALLAGLQTGMAVSFEFVERQPGEWVITRIQPLAATKAGAATQPHAGH